MQDNKRNSRASFTATAIAGTFLALYSPPVTHTLEGPFPFVPKIVCHLPPRDKGASQLGARRGCRIWVLGEATLCYWCCNSLLVPLRLDEIR